jgi:hypothetical protein
LTLNGKCISMSYNFFFFGGKEVQLRKKTKTLCLDGRRCPHIKILIARLIVVPYGYMS